MARTRAGIGRFAKYLAVVDTVDKLEAMENWGLHPSLGIFEEVVRNMLDCLRKFIGYMHGAKNALPCEKKVVKEVDMAEMWA